MIEKKEIAVIRGDGIGPEIMDSVLELLEAAGSGLKFNLIQAGEAVYLKGNTSGISEQAWEEIRKAKVLLKGPITTPLGGGYKSINVTIRKTLGLFANVRPCVSYHPFVPTKHPELDVIVVRENEEDLYAGIEHRQTQEVFQCLKLISRPGSERIIRYAFELAKVQGRKKVSCLTKNNIMKLTDGEFHRAFVDIATEYPEIETEHLIIDIGAARMADTPERFDVVVTSNLYGDILSDIVAQLTGSVGLGSSANVGQHAAMFEAIHGSAPDIAGKGIANPSGCLLAAIQMLVHLGKGEVATKLHNAWACTIEQGFHTADIYREASNTRRCSTQDFTKAVLENLGNTPSELPVASYQAQSVSIPQHSETKRIEEKKLVGVDVFVDEQNRDPNALALKLKDAETEKLNLRLITNRGVKVWPEGFKETFCTDHWRCRFKSEQALTHGDIIDLLSGLTRLGVDFIKTEHLCNFDGRPGYSLGQGE